jgi:uncharacterized protein YqhQ
LRCGTAFLLQVVVISILVFAFLGRPPMLIRMASRILLIPVIAGIAYELLKFNAAHHHIWIIRILSTPGLWLQKLTTREPDASMLEVAIAALQRLLVEEQLETAENSALSGSTVSSSPPITVEG